ncbi:MAG TPA: DinB family protein [Planctomycetota bacterium]|nr:DinB family protein [Planctomycetota bacterium]
MTSQDLSDLARRFRFNERFLAMLTKDLDETDWTARPPAGGNSAAWIVGHLAHFRRVTLRGLGADVPQAPWEPRVAMGSKPREAEPIAPPAELMRDFAESGAKLEARLLAMTPEDAATPTPPLPDGSKTRAALATFYHFHETYHLGQLGYLRRTRGRPGFM